MKKTKKVVERSSAAPAEMDWDHFSPIQVIVGSNFERAFRSFKSLVQAERVIADYRMRQSFESPSEKRRRKEKESIRRVEGEIIKAAKIADGSYDRDRQKKFDKKERKVKDRVEGKDNA